MNSEKWTEELEEVTIPDIPPLNHHDAMREYVLSQRRSSAVTVWMIALPLYVLGCAAMKVMFHAGLPFETSLRELQGSIGTAMSLALLIVLPLGAGVILVRPSIRLKRERVSRHRIVEIRMSPLNAAMLISALSLALFSIVLLFF
jgi:hypothetical protein